MKKLVSAVIFIGFACFVAFAQGGFKNLDDQVLEQNRGKVVVLAVSATWLPLSKQQALLLNRLAKKYASRKDIALYFVTVDSIDPKSKNFASDEQIKEFSTENKISVPILRDTDASTVKRMKVSQLPSFVLIKKDGQITETLSGLSEDNSALEVFFNQLVQKIDLMLTN
ncbi:MAG: TlpA family protein disulfide reductase [Pyrinomonadaceae bacterium]|nr:TlpA family protein disulfide reductase [Pyrinomonadaceae bacterium]MCX7639087.1 TlpA family protein disulfide reductase [Pyrinomonadaceae bacterium]MDW8303692.1 TlpA disulfide reductase family protein [Acidobacteriota bacterium]